MTKQYLVSKREINKIVEKATHRIIQGAGVDLQTVRDFLKSKKPVKLIAEGEVDVDIPLPTFSRYEYELIYELHNFQGKKGKLLWIGEE